MLRPRVRDGTCPRTQGESGSPDYPPSAILSNPTLSPFPRYVSVLPSEGKESKPPFPIQHVSLKARAAGSPGWGRTWLEQRVAVSYVFRVGYQDYTLGQLWARERPETTDCSAPVLGSASRKSGERVGHPPGCVLGEIHPRTPSAPDRKGGRPSLLCTDHQQVFQGVSRPRSGQNNPKTAFLEFKNFLKNPFQQLRGGSLSPNIVLTGIS